MLYRLGAPLVAIVLALLGSGSLAAEEHPGAEARALHFEQMMSGARLEGKFTVLTPTGASPAQDDLYMVSELTRADGNWVFHARMSYGDRMEMEFPVPVGVEWAGDTPVLTMTEQTVEGLGTFTVRLLFHEDRYAGTWQHGAFGGHMWGLLVRDEGQSDPESAPE